MATKKIDPNLPRNKEELQKLVRATKKKLGLKDVKLNNNEQDGSIESLQHVVDRINQLGPQKIASRIDQFISKKNKFNN